jgi:hypothetical protein
MLPNRACGAKGSSLRPRPAGCLPYFPTGAFTGADGAFAGGQRRKALGDESHLRGAGGRGFPAALTSAGTAIAATTIAFRMNPTLFFVMAPAPVLFEATSPLQDYVATGVPLTSIRKPHTFNHLPRGSRRQGRGRRKPQTKAALRVRKADVTQVPGDDEGTSARRASYEGLSSEGRMRRRRYIAEEW